MKGPRDRGTATAPHSSPSRRDRTTRPAARAASGQARPQCGPATTHAPAAAPACGDPPACPVPPRRSGAGVATSAPRSQRSLRTVMPPLAPTHPPASPQPPVPADQSNRLGSSPAGLLPSQQVESEKQPRVNPQSIHTNKITLSVLGWARLERATWSALALPQPRRLFCSDRVHDRPLHRRVIIVRTVQPERLARNERRLSEEARLAAAVALRGMDQERVAQVDSAG